MDLPFTTEQFLGVFHAYNQAIWPAQIVAYLLGLTALALAFWKKPGSGRWVSGILGLFWIWMGAGYHLTFFSRVNPAAILFGVVFIVQGLLFLVAGVVKNRLRFEPRWTLSGLAGLLCIAYALVIYPWLGARLGHGYPQAPVFGVAPCPTAIFTFGLLLWARRVPAWLLVVPVLWSLLGFSAALTLGIWEDIGLLVAGVVATAWILLRQRRARIAVKLGEGGADDRASRCR